MIHKTYHLNFFLLFMFPVKGSQELVLTQNDTYLVLELLGI